MRIIENFTRKFFTKNYQKYTNQKGAGVTFILLLIFLAAAVAYALTKFGDAPFSGSRQKARLDASLLAAQVTQLRTGFALLSSETSLNWFAVGISGGNRLALFDGSSSYSTDVIVPNPPVGNSWSFGLSSSGTVYAWTGRLTNLDVCEAFNAGLHGVSAVMFSPARPELLPTYIDHAGSVTLEPLTELALADGLGTRASGCVSFDGVQLIVAKLN